MTEPRTTRPRRRGIRIEWAFYSPTNERWFRAGHGTFTKLPTAARHPALDAAIEEMRALLGEPPDDLMCRWNVTSGRLGDIAKAKTTA